MEKLEALRTEHGQYTSNVESRVEALTEQLAKLKEAFKSMEQLLEHVSQMKALLEQDVERANVSNSRDIVFLKAHIVFLNH